MLNALLIVDMQNDFVLSESPFCVAGARASVPQVVALLNAARERRWLVVHVVREHKADGSDVELPRRKAFIERGGYAVAGSPGAQIIAELTPLAGEPKVVKLRFSGFFESGLDELLRSHGVQRVVICGTQYPNCIRATAFDALSLDYDVVIAEDATSAQTPEIARANLLDLRNVGIRCQRLDELMSNP